MKWSLKIYKKIGSVKLVQKQNEKFVGLHTYFQYFQEFYYNVFAFQ